MTLHRATPPPGQGLEASIQAPDQFGRVHRRDAGRGELDGERDAVETTAHLRHRRRVLRAERKVGIHTASPFDEELYRVGPRDVFEGRIVRRPGQ